MGLLISLAVYVQNIYSLLGLVIGVTNCKALKVCKFYVLYQICKNSTEVSSDFPQYSNFMSTQYKRINMQIHESFQFSDPTNLILKRVSVFRSHSQVCPEANGLEGIDIVPFEKPFAGILLLPN